MSQPPLGQGSDDGTRLQVTTSALLAVVGKATYRAQRLARAIVGHPTPARRPEELDRVFWR